VFWFVWFVVVDVETRVLYVTCFTCLKLYVFFKFY
jgi:hypothetical protein